MLKNHVTNLNYKRVHRFQNSVWDKNVNFVLSKCYIKSGLWLSFVWTDKAWRKDIPTSSFLQPDFIIRMITCSEFLWNQKDIWLYFKNVDSLIIEFFELA